MVCRFPLPTSRALKNSDGRQLKKLSPFTKNTLALLELIPRGRVTSYAALARALGQARAARAVGNALHKNPWPGRLPCHRVLRSDGSLGGYVGGQRAKAALLRREGVNLRKGRVPDFKGRFFDFSPKQP